MIRFHHPCIVCRIPAGLCHKEGNHRNSACLPTMSGAPSAARQLTEGALTTGTLSLSHVPLGGGWTSRGGGTEGLQGGGFAPIPDHRGCFKHCYGEHLQDGCPKGERWLASGQTDPSSGLELPHDISTASHGSFFRVTPSRSNPLTQGLHDGQQKQTHLPRDFVFEEFLASVLLKVIFFQLPSTS